MRWEKELHFLRSVSMHAGDLAMGYATRELTPEAKDDDSPVTEADKECEKLIVARIEAEFPQDGILGEEGASKPGRSGRKWIVDPIDGTRDFIRGLPLWGNLIGLEVDGAVVAGVCNLVPRREMYSAVAGEGAWLNEKPIRISAIDTPGRSLLCLNGIQNMGGQPFVDRVVGWAGQFWAVRAMGGCMDAMMVASGRAEIWLEPQAKAWDLAPLKVILEEAGAIFQNFNGESSIYGGNAVAYVPGLKPAVRDLLQP